jgi:poly(3-hydroxybutyrate) depolymerase
LDVEFRGKTYPVDLFVPEGRTGPGPMVVLLHAGGGNTSKLLKQSRYDVLAEERGIVLALPLAVEFEDRGPRWNSGKRAEVTKRDDVAFLDALVTTAKDKLCVDRVMAVGFSAGAQMAHRWSCEGKQVNAATAAAGSLLVPTAGCGPSPVRAYVGRDDKLFDGPPLDGSSQPSAVETMDLWRRINGCEGGKQVDKKGDTSCTTWKGCKASTVLCVVEGFGHGYPAPHHKSAPDCDATKEGWAWFEGLN